MPNQRRSRKSPRIDPYWIHNTVATLPALRRASGGVAVLPLASIESHGPHLPLGADPLAFAQVLDQAVRRELVAVLPILHYSTVEVARMFPGAINLRSEVLMDVVENILDEAYRNGFKKLVLVHGHGGVAFLHQAFMQRLLEREKPYAAYSVACLPGCGEAIGKLLKSKEWGHACEFETSLDMATIPHLVDMTAVGRKTFPTQVGPRLGPGTVTTIDWLARHPEMAVGKPQLATVEKGRRIVRLWADALVDRFREIKADKVTPAWVAQYRRRARAPG